MRPTWAGGVNLHSKIRDFVIKEFTCMIKRSRGIMLYRTAADVTGNIVAG